jgi:hypothetical protein
VQNWNRYGQEHTSHDLAELVLQVGVALAMTMGLERLRLTTHSIVHDVGGRQLPLDQLVQARAIFVCQRCFEGHALAGPAVAFDTQLGPDD